MSGELNLNKVKDDSPELHNFLASSKESVSSLSATPCTRLYGPAVTPPLWSRTAAEYHQTSPLLCINALSGGRWHNEQWRRSCRCSKVAHSWKYQTSNTPCSPRVSLSSFTTDQLDDQVSQDLMTDDNWFISGLQSVDPIIFHPSRLSAEWWVFLKGEPPDAFPHWTPSQWQGLCNCTAQWI